jgi:hypothetical protein
MSVLLYDNPASGNCYKVRLILTLLGIEFERREPSVIDLSDRAEVLGGLSLLSNLPTVVLEDERPLTESNAILRSRSLSGNTRLARPGSDSTRSYPDHFLTYPSSSWELLTPRCPDSVAGRHEVASATMTRTGPSHGPGIGRRSDGPCPADPRHPRASERWRAPARGDETGPGRPPPTNPAIPKRITG